MWYLGSPRYNLSETHQVQQKRFYINTFGIIFTSNQQKQAPMSIIPCSPALVCDQLSSWLYPLHVDLSIVFRHSIFEAQIQSRTIRPEWGRKCRSHAMRSKILLIKVKIRNWNWMLSSSGFEFRVRVGSTHDSQRRQTESWPPAGLKPPIEAPWLGVWAFTPDPYAREIHIYIINKWFCEIDLGLFSPC